jgi:hypothetical protein
MRFRLCRKVRTWRLLHENNTSVLQKRPKKAGEMRIKLPISITDRSRITNLPVDTQILKGRTTWSNLPSIFLILHDFDYLPRFFSVSWLIPNR